MNKFFKVFFLLLFFFNSAAKANNPEFNLWLDDFKLFAKKQGVSDRTIELTLNKSKFLPKVIEYDRYQPEFYEDTLTYINKRVTKSKVKKGISLYKKQEKIINKIEKNFYVNKELLLALMGIETNFGKYLGKMDIISSLATLSFDKRRSKFFTNELITLLKLVDAKIIDHTILYGSWAGAFGNFQFMPTTIKQYAIDYDGNSVIGLKDIEDSFASAANYIHRMGWKDDEPCFYKIELKKEIPKKYLNTSARKIENKKKFKFFKKYIKNSNLNNLDGNLLAGIITPDKDIVSNSNDLKPAYIVFNNYELILKWNRSLRFALAVCSLKNEIKNEI